MKTDINLKILNLGCGLDATVPSTVSMDVSPATKPDIVHDLNQMPWPVSSNTFDAVYCQDVIEHLNDVVKVMEEIHRVLKSGGKVFITTPHYSCSNSFTDPTHKQHLGFFSFDYFIKGHPLSYYSDAIFRKNKARLEFLPRFKNRVIRYCANRWPAFYEEHLAWIFPAWLMKFELEAVK